MASKSTRRPVDEEATFDALTPTERHRVYNALANLPLLEFVQSSTVESLLRVARPWAPTAGTVLLHEGERPADVVFLLEGIARITHHQGHAEFSPKILAAPCCFGHMELLAGTTTVFQDVEMVTDGHAARVCWGVMRGLLEEDHALCLAWLEDLSRQFLHTADAIRHTTFGGLKARIGNVLLAYADLFGRRLWARADALGDAPKNARLEAPLSRHQLARHVASPKRSILRVLQQLERAGHIALGGRTIAIVNRQGLEAELPRGRLGLAHRASVPISFRPKRSLGG